MCSGRAGTARVENVTGRSRRCPRWARRATRRNRSGPCSEGQRAGADRPKWVRCWHWFGPAGDPPASGPHWVGTGPVLDRSGTGEIRQHSIGFAQPFDGFHSDSAASHRGPVDSDSHVSTRDRRRLDSTAIARMFTAARWSRAGVGPFVTALARLATGADGQRTVDGSVCAAARGARIAVQALPTVVAWAVAGVVRIRTPLVVAWKKRNHCGEAIERSARAVSPALDVG